MWNWPDNEVLQLDGQQDKLTLSEVWDMQCLLFATNLEIQGLNKSAMLTAWRLQLNWHCEFCFLSTVSHVTIW